MAHKRTPSKPLGEASVGLKLSGTDNDIAAKTRKLAKKAVDSGAEAVTAAGGGNPRCGRLSEGTDRVRVDYTGTSVMVTNVSVSRDVSE